MLFGPDKVFTLTRWSSVVPFLEEMQEILEHLDKFPERTDVVYGGIDSVFTKISREIVGLVTLTDPELPPKADALLKEYTELLHRAARLNITFDIETNHPHALKEYPLREDFTREDMGIILDSDNGWRARIFDPGAQQHLQRRSGEKYSDGTI
jgi:hypothetical protein